MTVNPIGKRLEVRDSVSVAWLPVRDALILLAAQIRFVTDHVRTFCQKS